jgi:membrane associated rhomboid family serine protease
VRGLSLLQQSAAQVILRTGRETPVFLPLRDENPTFRTPWVTGALIAVNAGAFLLPWLSGSTHNQLVTTFGLVPARLALEAGGTRIPWETLFSSMFLHANVLHLGGNLLYLWIFGNNVEDVLGHGKFLVFYALAGLGAHAAHMAINLSSPIPTIGASGAIAGILAAYLLRYPKARVVCLLFLFIFVRLIRVPAGIVILIWLASQVLGGVSELGSIATGGVAWFEHLGGFVCGLVFFPLLGGTRKRKFAR